MDENRRQKQPCIGYSGRCLQGEHASGTLFNLKGEGCTSQLDDWKMMHPQVNVIPFAGRSHLPSTDIQGRNACLSGRWLEHVKVMNDGCKPIKRSAMIAS